MANSLPERGSGSPVLVALPVAGLGGSAQHLVERGLGVRAGVRSTAANVPDIAMTPFALASA
jgi:hypothetical protein